MQASMRASRGWAPICAIALAAAMLLSTTRGVAAEGSATDPAKLERVRELNGLTGTDRIGPEILEVLLQQFRQAYPSVPASYWDDLRAMVQVDELAELIIPVYAQRFSSEELKELIAFYKSPIGRKVIATLPEVARESTAISQDWSQKQTNKLLEKLKADGYKPPTP